MQNKNDCFKHLLLSWRGFEQALDQVWDDPILSVQQKQELVWDSIYTADVQGLIPNRTHEIAEGVDPLFYYLFGIGADDQAKNKTPLSSFYIKHIDHIHYQNLLPIGITLGQFYLFHQLKRDFYSGLNAYKTIRDQFPQYIQNHYDNDEVNHVWNIVKKQDYFNDGHIQELISYDTVDYLRRSEFGIRFEFIKDVRTLRRIFSNSFFHMDWQDKERILGYSFIPSEPYLSTLESPHVSESTWYVDGLIRNADRLMQENPGTYNPQELEVFRNELNRIKYKTDPETGYVLKDQNDRPMAIRNRPTSKDMGLLYDVFTQGALTNKDGKIQPIGFVDPESSDFFVTWNDYKSSKLFESNNQKNKDKTNIPFNSHDSSQSPEKFDKSMVDADLQNNLQAMNGTSQKQQIISYTLPTIGKQFGGQTGVMRLPGSGGGNDFITYVFGGALDDMAHMTYHAWDNLAVKGKAFSKTFKGALTLDGPANGFNFGDVAVMFVLDNPSLRPGFIQNGQARRYYSDTLGFLSGAVTMHAEMMYRSGGSHLMRYGLGFNHLHSTVYNNIHQTGALMRHYGKTAPVVYLMAKKVGVEGTKAALSYAAAKSSAAAAATTVKTMGSAAHTFAAPAASPSFFFLLSPSELFRNLWSSPPRNTGHSIY